MKPLLGREAPAVARLGVCIVLGVFTAIVVPSSLPWVFRVLAGWDVFALVFLLWVWRFAHGADAAETRRIATREDDGHTVSALLVLSGSVASLGGTAWAFVEAGEMREAWARCVGVGAHLADCSPLLLLVLAITTVVLSWLLLHTEYMLHYALLYYSKPEGGVNFPSDGPGRPPDPDYRDFAYLAFTLGMTYQVSDTAITQPAFRRRLTGHALLSFLYGTVVVAFTINVVAGLLR
jgi:uncharacterized membrane protein